VERIYRDKEELMSKISLFAKEMAQAGSHRLALQEIKTNVHWDTYQALMNKGLSHGVIMNRLNFRTEEKAEPKL